jgi:hypothetical protein
VDDEIWHDRVGPALLLIKSPTELPAKALFEEMREIRRLTDAQEARAVVARIKTENYLTMRRPAGMGT